jgi:serine/threonine protein kinase
MMFRATEGAEPFPGYTLVKRLGTGGFGEVWHATAPGGLAKAIKVIYGGISDARAEQELLALARIREVRHPFLLSLDRFETLDDQVLIVMELAEASLLDRFEKCREAGLDGIPRSELLGYLLDAADALDFMNDQHDLQHADIKPQNLLLLAGRIKVADFGLVKNLQGATASVAGGATPIYAAPEVFDGKVSRTSDQYSLAIVYQEMLTGHRPFPGKSALQLAHQHINCAPFLDPLPAPDRTVLSKALAKWPNQRYSNCRMMVNALLQFKDQNESEPAPRIRSLRMKRAVTEPEPEIPEAADAGMAGSPGDDESALSTRSRRATSLPALSLWPTLFVGIGGLGGAVVRQLRQRLILRFGGEHLIPIFRALIIDTDRNNLQRPGAANEPGSFQAHEILHVPLYRPDHYRNQSAGLLQWLDRRWLYNIPHSLSTEGMRPLGRLAMIDHVAEILSRVDEAVAAISSPDAMSFAERALACKIRQAAPRIYVIAGIGGGTGAGMVLDLGYLVRQVLENRGLAADALCGLLLYARPETNQETDLNKINSFATVLELNHYFQPAGRYLGDGTGKLRAQRGHCAPFTDTYLAELSNVTAGSPANVASIVEYLYSNLTTEAGDCIDHYRQNTRTETDAEGAACVRTLGLYRLTIPRLELADEVGAMLARQLIRSWIEAQGGDRLRPVIDLPLASWGLDGDAVSERLEKLTKNCLGVDPEQAIGRAINSGLPKSGGMTASAVQQIFAELDGVLGAGPSAPGYGLSPLEKSISNAATNLGQKTAEVVESWLIERVNDLQGRISIAEECVETLLRHLNTVAHGAERLYETAQATAVEARKKIETLENFSPAPESRWRKLSGWRAEVKPDPVEIFLTYGQNRLKQIRFRAAGDLLRPVIVRARRFKGEMDVFKEKLTTLLETMSAAGIDEPVKSDTGCSLMLLPEGRYTVRGAARDLFRRLENVLIDRLDRLIEESVMRPLGGVWHVVHANAELGAVFGLRLSRMSRELALDAMSELDAAQLFQKSCENDAEAGKRLAHFLESSLPALVEAGGVEHLIVAAPPGEAGHALTNLVTRTYANVPCTSVAMEGDVLLCWEVSQLPLLRAAARLIGEDRDAMDLARKVHTRIDVHWIEAPGK